MKTINNTSKTKTGILNAAQDLMLAKGFIATSLDEICKEASTTKGSFFHYFNNKEKLGIELADRFSQMTIDLFKTACKKAGDDPLDRIHGLMDLVVKFAETPDYKGCLIGTFSQEISKTHPGIIAACGSAIDLTIELLKENLAKAKEKYAPNSSIDVDSLASCFISIIQGSIIIIKAKKDYTVMRKNLLQYRQYLEFLFKK
ncbi:MAG: TetR/AcrR family transcriptional regulator [Candidatus Anammoxibacter sp.]